MLPRPAAGIPPFHEATHVPDPTLLTLAAAVVRLTPLRACAREGLRLDAADPRLGKGNRLWLIPVPSNTFKGRAPLAD